MEENLYKESIRLTNFEDNIMAKIIFFNHFNRGDLHAGKEFIKQIQSQYPDIVMAYLHNNPSKITEEFSVPLEGNPNHLDRNILFYAGENEDEIYVNTWMASDWDLFCRNHGGNMFTLCEMWGNIFKTLNQRFNLKLKLKKDKEEYLTKINWDFLPKENLERIDKFVKKDVPRILIANNTPHSGQSFLSTMSEFIEPLAEKYNSIDFICTTKYNSNMDNVYFTEDIIQDKTGCDLHEISYLSRSCNALVSKNSGPATFFETYDNMMDSNKHIVAFNIKHPDYEDIRETLAYRLNLKSNYINVPIQSINLTEQDNISVRTSLEKLLDSIV